MQYSKRKTHNGIKIRLQLKNNEIPPPDAAYFTAYL